MQLSLRTPYALQTVELFTLLILVIAFWNWNEVKVASSALKEFSFVAGSAIKDVAFRFIDTLIGIDVSGALGRIIGTIFDNLIKLHARTVSPLRSFS